jgi:hypothetical protein
MAKVFCGMEKKRGGYTGTAHCIAAHGTCQAPKGKKMLTASERAWLEDRKHKSYCRYCNVSKLCANPFASGYSCPLTGNMKDAAEFSERVAAKLAQAYMKIIDAEFDIEIRLICEACPAAGRCNMDCCDSILKWARLQVEEEME